MTVLETEPRLMSRVVAPQISEFYRALHAAADVEVLLGVEVTGFEGDGALARLRLRDGSALETDFAAVGVGILPNVGVAAAAGLEVDNGVVVDECGATSDPQIWAAGDCTSHPSALYQRRIRLESVHNAMAQAKAVAGNLCGKSAPYDEAPWFWSDQYDTKLQIAGLAQVAQETVMRGTPDDGAFTVFHINDGVVVAADTVNAMRDHIACRKLVGERARIRPEVLADTDIPVQELASRAQ